MVIGTIIIIILRDITTEIITEDITIDITTVVMPLLSTKIPSEPLPSMVYTTTNVLLDYHSYNIPTNLVELKTIEK